MSPESAVATNILPFFTQNSPAINSSEYEHNHQGRCWETMPPTIENLIERRLAEMGL
jgi:hypothetical protein